MSLSLSSAAVELCRRISARSLTGTDRTSSPSLPCSSGTVAVTVEIFSSVRVGSMRIMTQSVNACAYYATYTHVHVHVYHVHHYNFFINPRRMREGYGSWFVCLSVCLLSR